MILGLCGYAQVGKDTIANQLENYTRVAFADVLKKEVTKMLQTVGIEADLWGKDKAEWRDMLVFWGAKVRSLDPDYWIKQLYMQIGRRMAEGDRIAVSDVRYANEVRWIQKHNGLVVRIVRPGYNAANEEEKNSIREIDTLFDLPGIVNDGTPRDAAVLMRKILATWVPIIGRKQEVYFFEPLEKEISVEDMQKIVDANQKLVKELKDGTNTNTISK